MAEITPGRYRHYKGNEYTVLGVARHSETLEELVVYRQEYGDRGLWVRPAAMFAETVVVYGQIVPRFRFVGLPPARGQRLADRRQRGGGASTNRRACSPGWGFQIGFTPAGSGSHRTKIRRGACSK